MRCVIIGTAYPLRGGIAHYNGILAAELRQRHSVDIITFKRQYPTFLFPGSTQDEGGGTIHGDPAPQLIDSINPFNWIAVAREIRLLEPDVLIFKYWIPFFGPCFGTIARLVKRRSATKVICICDNVLPHEHRPFDRSFTRYAFAPVDAFIVQSAAVERELRALVPNARYRLVPHPVYTMFGTAREKQLARTALGLRHERVLLFFGYVRRYKGLHVLIDALASVVRHMDVQLLIVGEFYDSEASYREHIRSLGLESRIRLEAGYLPNDRVAEFFSAADAVVVPYLSATQSGIIQIAYNFDKPVIATDVGGLAEVITDGKTGLIAPPNDIEGLSAKILEFYQKDLEGPLVANVRVEKLKYSWNALTAAIEELARE